MKFLLKYRKITEVWYQDTQDALNIAKYNDDDNMIDLLKSSEIIDIENTIVK